jgi:hypothetical protein
MVFHLANEKGLEPQVPFDFGAVLPYNEINVTGAEIRDV